MKNSVNVKNYLNQVATLLLAGSSNKYGEASFTSLQIKCRIEPIDSLSSSSSSQVDANIYTDYSGEVLAGSRIVFGSVSYVVTKSSEFYGKFGNEVYKLLEVQRGSSNV